MYRYVENDPTNATDPTGKNPLPPQWGYEDFITPGNEYMAVEYNGLRAGQTTSKDILDWFDKANFSGTTAQEKKIARQSLERLLAGADSRKLAPEEIQPLAGCASWTEVIGEGWDKIPNRIPEGKITQKFFWVSYVYYHNPFITFGARGGILGFSRGNDHAIIKVQFTNGHSNIFYLDNGWLAGEGKHIFGPPDIPFVYYQILEIKIPGR